MRWLLSLVAVPLGAALFYGALRLALRLHRAPDALDPPPPARGVVALRAAAVFAAALLFYRLSSWPAPHNLDTVRDLLSARDCAVAGTCSSGPYTSVGSLFQGASLIRLCASALRLGLPLAAVEAALQVFHAASAALTFVAVLRYVHPRLALSAAAVYVGLSPYVLDYPVVFNISMVLLPLAGFHLFALDLVARGRLPSALAAGVCLGFAIDGHVLCALLIPIFLFTLSAATPRPFAAVPVGLLGLAVDAAVCSPGSWRGNVTSLLDGELADAIGLGLVAMLACAELLRDRLAALDPRPRCRALLAVTTAAGLGAYLATVVLVDKAPPMYATNALLGVAVAAAALLDLAVTRLPALRADARRGELARVALALAAVAALHHLRHDHSGPDRWSMREVDRVARAVFPGWRFDELAAHLQTPTHGLLAALGAVEPLRAPPAAAPPHTDDVLLLRVPARELPAATPPGWTVVPFDNGYAAVARPIASYLDRRRLRACYGPPGAAPWACVDGDLGAPALRAQLSRPPFSDRMFFMVKRANAVAPLERRQSAEGCAVTFEVGVDATAGQGPRRIELLPGKVAWRIARVTGARHRGGLPGTSVVLEGGDAGTITFTADVPRGEVIHEMYSVPPVAELGLDEGELLRLVRARSR
ncbi:MAG: hypothetical protein Q8S73_08555 [Deltaproteobacteria bacterium]|nr:hypothetical protein [Deltaproteobacteria bacterium]